MSLEQCHSAPAETGKKARAQRHYQKHREEILAKRAEKYQKEGERLKAVCLKRYHDKREYDPDVVFKSLCKINL